MISSQRSVALHRLSISLSVPLASHIKLFLSLPDDPVQDQHPYLREVEVPNDLNSIYLYPSRYYVKKSKDIENGICEDLARTENRDLVEALLNVERRE